MMGLGIADGFCGAFAFLDDEEHIYREIGEGFFQAAGPPDFERIDAGAIAEAEEDARVLRGEVAHAAFGLVVAGEVAGDEFQVGADAVAIRFCADEADGDPVILFGEILSTRMGSEGRIGRNGNATVNSFGRCGWRRRRSRTRDRRR